MTSDESDASSNGEEPQDAGSDLEEARSARGDDEMVDEQDPNETTEEGSAEPVDEAGEAPSAETAEAEAAEAETSEGEAADGGASGDGGAADGGGTSDGGGAAPWWRRRWVAAVAGVAAVAAVAVVAAVVLLGGDDGDGTGTEPGTEAVTISPSGGEVDRLRPIMISFSEEPDEDDPAALVSLTPAAEGSYSWSSDRRTLVFQATYPGLVRGTQYTVRVNGAAAGIGEDAVQTFTVGGKLEVAHLIPADGDREVPVNAPILVQFNRAVVPLTLLSEQAEEQVLTFAPAVAGTGEWLSTSLYKFVPDGLVPSTAYTVTVTAGLTSAADGVLEAAVEFSFTTVSPAISRITPDDNTKFVPRDQSIEVVFNQAMDRASVEAGFALLDADASPVAGAFAWSEGDTMVAFTPAVPLTEDARYEIQLDAGLESAGQATTAESREASFETAPRATVVRTYPADGEMQAGRYGVDFEFAAPVDFETFDGLITISGIDAEDIDIYSWDDLHVSASVVLQPSTEYTVRLTEGALDRQGLPVPPYELRFTTEQLPASISFAIPGRYATYQSSTEPELLFYVVNFEEVTFKLHELEPAQALALLREPYAYSDAQVRSLGTPLREWTVAVEGDANQFTLNSTTLGDGAPLPPGDYLVTTDSSLNGDPYLAFAVVDTEIVTKLAQDELLVWVLDHDSGEPLSGVSVSVNGANSIEPFGITTRRGTTDGSGLVSFDAPTVLELQQRRLDGRRYIVQVDADGRRGVGSTDWQRGAEPWLIDVPFDYSPREFVAHLYTDRPIYRPGETVYFKGVVRRDDDAAYSVPASPPEGLELVVRDAQYDEVERRPLDLNEYGSFALEYVLPEGAPTGFYSLELHYDAGPYEAYLTGTSFTVAEFRVPEFRVEVTADEPDVIDGETVEATALASFFFGGGVGGAEVDWAVLSSPSSVRSEDFPGYSFSDFDFFREATIEDPLRASGSTTTDASGMAEIDVPAALRGSEGTQRYEVSVSVSDESAQVVAGSTSVTVHPASFYAGLRPDDYLVESGDTAVMNVATIDTSGAALGNRAVVVRVYSRQWVTTLERTESGSRRYRSEPVDELLATIPATTDADGHTTVEYSPEDPGTLRFVVEATDAQGRSAFASAHMWASGGNFVRWRVRNDDIFELIADQESYEPGDTAEVLIPTSYPGATALVTEERAHIIAREVRTLETASDVIEVEISERHVPNVYVSVALYRAPTETDPVPRYQLGYVKLPVSTASRVLNVEISDVPQPAQPGETVTYEIQVTDDLGNGQQAELSVAVVDEAVLSLADEVGPDGLGAFWFERGLGVLTASSLAVSVDRTNEVVSEPESGGKGGGSDSDSLRSNFQTTALWEGQVETDSEGRATVELPLPDNLTTWRIAVRAISGDTQVGDGIAELLVTRPLLARPALPRFLRVGDEFAVRTLVRNATDEVQEVTVALDSAGIAVADGSPQTARVAPGESGVFAWPATVSAPGEARVRFTATTGELEDAVELTLPVLLDVTPETTATGGVVDDDPAVEALYLPDYALTENGGLEVNVQASLVNVLTSELRHFPIPTICGRPCESTDSISSRIVATVAALGTDERSPTATTTADVAELERRHRSDGGWGWCAVRCDSDPEITAWAVIALDTARDAGVTVDINTFGRAGSYLGIEVSRARDVAAVSRASWEAFLRYAIVRSQSEPRLSPVRAIFEQNRDQLTNWGRGYLLLALMEDGDDPLNQTAIRALANDLAADAISSANGSHWEDAGTGVYLGSDLRTTSIVLRALVAVEPEHPLIEETARWLVIARTAEGWETGFQRAHAINALAAFAESTGELLGDYAFTVTLDESEVLTGEFRPRGGENAASAEVPLEEVPLGVVSLLRLEREARAPGRLYYALNLRYQTPAREVESLNRGMAVSREYSLLDDPGTSIDSAPLGEVVRITLTVLTDADRKFVVVEDALPAGLEPIDPQLKIIPLDLRQQLEEEQQEAVLGPAPDYAAPWFAWYYNPWDDVQIRDERLVLFADRLPAGVHEYVFYARATTPGDYFVAPTVVEESFFPEVFGRSDSQRFGVVE